MFFLTTLTTFNYFPDSGIQNFKVLYAIRPHPASIPRSSFSWTEGYCLAMPGGTNRKKQEKVVCRVLGCVDKHGARVEMNVQSYKDHLKRKHPEENPNDPRGYCTKKQLTLNFGCQLSSATSSSIDGDKDQSRHKRRRIGEQEQQNNNTEPEHSSIILQ